MFNKLKLLLYFLSVVSKYFRYDQASTNTLKRDTINARKRDLVLCKQNGYNWRGNLILISAHIGFILSIWMIFFFHGELRDEELVICSTMISVFGSILTDASLFEFGNNSNRDIRDIKK